MKTTRRRRGPNKVKGPVEVKGVTISLSLEDLDQIIRDRAGDEFERKFGSTIQRLTERGQAEVGLTGRAFSTPPMPETGWTPMNGQAPGPGLMPPVQGMNAANPRPISAADMAESRLRSLESSFKMLGEARERHRAASNRLEALDPTNPDSIPASGDLMATTRDLVASQVYFWRVCNFMDGPNVGAR